jgi:hypothetical protein
VDTMIKVARYHLTPPVLFLSLPLALLAIVFAANAARGGATFRDGLASVFLLFFAMGVQRIGGRWLPFGLALGATRRSFYAGTALLGVSMSLVYGLVIAGLQAIVRTAGWGQSIAFFQVPSLPLNGHWYATWLTSFVGLSLLFVYGMWYGIVNRRWGMLGLLVFVAAQALAAILVFSRAGLDWHLTSLSRLEVTGVLAALTVVCLGGGQATIRRVTV